MLFQYRSVDVTGPSKQKKVDSYPSGMVKSQVDRCLCCCCPLLAADGLGLYSLTYPRE